MKENIKYIILIILMALILVNSYILLQPKKEEMKENKVAFRINKIECYTSANAIEEEEIQENWNVDIYQYTDIAVYIEKLEDKTIKNIYVDNINITDSPQNGTVIICKKKIEEFAKPILLNEVIKEITYEVANDSKAEFLEDCSKPIIIGYVNNIKSDYTIANNQEKLEFNETILRKTKILSSEIMAQISFNVNIIDAEGTKYVCKVELEIPIEELFNGQKIVEKNDFMEFIREDMIK